MTTFLEETFLQVHKIKNDSKKDITSVEFWAQIQCKWAFDLGIEACFDCVVLRKNTEDKE